MKPFAILPLTIVFTFIATTLQSAEPEKLARLRISYESAITKAITPIQKTYLAELEKLKLEFTKAGNLEAAIAVDAEMKKRSIQTEQKTASTLEQNRPTEPEISRKKADALLIDDFCTALWTYESNPNSSGTSMAVASRDGVITLAKDGTKFQWEIDHGKITIATGDSKNETEYTLETKVITVHDKGDFKRYLVRKQRQSQPN